MRMPRGVRLDRGFSIIVVPEGGGGPRTVTVSARVLRLVVGGVLALFAAGVLTVAHWNVRRTQAARELAAANELRVAERARADSLHRQVAELAANWEKARHIMVGRPDTIGAGLWLAHANEPADGRPVEPAAVRLDAESWTWPLAVSGYMTQALEANGARNHPGIDIAVQTGSYILAAAAGTVKEAAADPDYGLFVQIDHGNGLYSLYGHASELYVARGSQVRRGEVVAMSGSTGNSTAPHLHFEIVRHGAPVDPQSMVAPPPQ